MSKTFDTLIYIFRRVPWIICITVFSLYIYVENSNNIYLSLHLLSPIVSINKIRSLFLSNSNGRGSKRAGEWSAHAECVLLFAPPVVKVSHKLPSFQSIYFPIISEFFKEEISCQNELTADREGNMRERVNE